MKAPGASVVCLSYKSENKLYKMWCRCIFIKQIIQKESEHLVMDI